jgi:hypothetical protein
MLASKLMKILPILMVGDWNEKHVHWNSRLITTNGRGLCNCTNEYSCLIYGPDTPTTMSYNFFPIPNALDIINTKDPFTPVYPTMCSGLSADHLPVLINTQCQSSFLNPLDHPNLRTDWSKFHASLEIGLPSNPDLPDEVAIDACQETVKHYFDGIGRIHFQVLSE